MVAISGEIEGGEAGELDADLLGQQDLPRHMRLAADTLRRVEWLNGAASSPIFRPDQSEKAVRPAVTKCKAARASERLPKDQATPRRASLAGDLHSPPSSSNYPAISEASIHAIGGQGAMAHALLLKPSEAVHCIGGAR